MASTGPLSIETDRHCADCGSPAGGHFCAHCGQETRIETPSVREFLREFIQDQIALEGKLLRTLRVLVLAPGQLTLDFISGRRQRYIRPLRLYITMSVICFAVLGFGGRREESDDGVKPTKPVSSATQESPKTTGDDAQAAPGGSEGPPQATGQLPGADEAEHSGHQGPTGGTSHALDELRGFKVGWAPLDGRLGRLLDRPERLPTSIGDAMRNEAPIAMFFLLPIFAAMLKIAYLGRGHRYGVHLLFALHVHAFTFLDIAVNRIPWPGIVEFGLNGWAFVYLVMALRRVYGGGKVMTTFGALFLLFVYGILIISGLFTAGLISLVFNT